jgi:bifunctional ADP-heptose synthase (sugar kinase/adenylyltransferase)
MQDLQLLDLSKKLQKLALESHTSIEKPCSVIGFDGFTDDIIEVVKTRDSITSYTPMKKIEELGHRILEASSVSCNIELVTKRRKIGGNAPILANALLQANHTISFIGAIGDKGLIEPLFEDMASQCKNVYTLTKSAHTDALEFEDGKILLGKHESIIHIDFDLILSSVGKDNLIKLLEEAKLFVSANWTMIPLMNQIWQHLKEEILSNLSPSSTDFSRYLFIDLADPKKREDKDLLKAIELLKNWGPTHRVVLGLNSSESQRIASLIGYTKSNDNEENALQMAKAIKQHMNLASCLIHTKEFVIGCNEQEEIILHSPYCPNPVITTGAGDNFNAGFCNGLLYGLNLKESLILAIATAGFYIRNGHSPNQEELNQFLLDWNLKKI